MTMNTGRQRTGTNVAALGLVALLAFISGATNARAQAMDGRVRVGLESTVLGLTATGFEDDADGDNGTAELTFGPGLSGVFFNLGYGFSETLTAGARLKFGLGALTEIIDGEEQDTKTRNEASLWAYAEFNLAGADKPHLFLGPELGVEFGEQRTRMEEGFDPRVSQAVAGIGGIAGFRTFIGDRAAVEVALHVRLMGGKQTTELVRGVTEEQDIGRLALLLTVGGSLWVGGQPTYVPAAPAPTPSEVRFAPAEAALDDDPTPEAEGAEEAEGADATQEAEGADATPEAVQPAPTADAADAGAEAQTETPPTPAADGATEAPDEPGEGPEPAPDGDATPAAEPTP